MLIFYVTIPYLLTLAWDSNSELDVSGYKVCYDEQSQNYAYCDESLHFIKYDISGRKMTVTAIRSNGSIIESFEIVKPIPINGIQLLLLEN